MYPEWIQVALVGYMFPGDMCPGVDAALVLTIAQSTPGDTAMMVAARG